MAIRPETLKNIWKNSAFFQRSEERNNSRQRAALKNDNFSILCSNCIGGIIYHRLGKPFLSPTINMHMSNPDFIEFCIHLDTYLSEALQFIPAEEPYPVAELTAPGLPVLTLYFNHAKTEEDARNDWERRKPRLNRDNLYLILFNLDGVTTEMLHRLESVPCKNKVIFTAEELPEIPWACCIKPHLNRPSGMCYIDRDLWGVCTFEKHFDYVAWLNT